MSAARDPTRPGSDGFAQAVAAALVRSGGGAAAGDAAERPPRLDAIGLEQRLGGAAGGRYRVGRLLGAGGIGRVLLVEDRNLRREIAVKTPLPGQAGDAAALEAFVAEARITASLEHPGIVPVIDLDLSADGQVFYAMRRVHGRTLGAAIGEALAGGRRPPEIAGTNDVVTILLKACDALAYAHSRGVVHRDLKPENIMLGGFGEVLVLDWGASSSREHGGRPGSDGFGTPAFMSPEQARQEAIDARSDVYSLGATLFQALFLRFPLDAPDPEAFLARKRRGELDPPAPHELDARTRPLAAIALQAMAADPARRYQTVEALAADLRSYQAGQAMVAYRGSPLERAGRWLRLWWRPLGTAAACAATLAVAVWLVWGERLKEVAAWGPPVLAEDFSDGSWTARWRPEPADGFAVRDGRLVTAAPTAAFLRSRRVFTGPVAVEYDGEITPGSRPCDLSLAWWDGSGDPGPEGAPSEGWLLQVGAWDDHFCGFYRNHAGRMTQVARRALRLETGRVYRFRWEIDGARIALRLDGVEVMACEELFPVRPGRLGLYGYYPGKAFDNLRVYVKGVPERMSPIALGDDDAQDGNTARAVERYQRVLASHPAGALADEAWYKIGHCRLVAGDEDGAWQAFRQVRRPPFADRVAVHRLDRLFADRDDAALLRELPEVAVRSPECRRLAESAWSEWAASLGTTVDPAVRARLVRLCAARAQLFPGTGPSVLAYGRALCRLGEWQRVVDECGDDPLSVSDALAAQGRPEEALRRFGYMDWKDAALRGQQGELEAVAASHAGGARAWALAKLGRIAEARQEDPGNPQILAAAADWTAIAALPAERRWYGPDLALAAAGRLGTGPEAPSCYALQLLGREVEAETEDLGAVEAPWCQRALAAAAAGQRPQLAAARARLAAEPVDWGEPLGWFGRLVVLPHLAWRDGDRAAWPAALAEAQAVRRRGWQRAWHLAAYIAGKIDAAALLAQPCRAEGEAWLRLGDGIKAELRGDPAAARAAYRAYQALPVERRLLGELRLDPQVERFVAWRVQELGPR